MENKNNNKIIIYLLIVINLILSVLCILFATDTISLKFNDVDNSEINENATENNKDNNEINNSNYNETSNQNTIGKINIKRDGVVSLEKVPTDIVGKYVYSENDYFILNSDGTAIASNDSITYNFTYQLTYNKNQILVELYDNTSNGFYYSPFMIGTTHTAGSGATAILMTPSAMTEKVYIKAANNEENK